MLTEFGKAVLRWIALGIGAFGIGMILAGKDHGALETWGIVICVMAAMAFCMSFARRGRGGHGGSHFGYWGGGSSCGGGCGGCGGGGCGGGG